MARERMSPKESRLLLRELIISLLDGCPTCARGFNLDKLCREVDICRKTMSDFLDGRIMDNSIEVLDKVEWWVWKNINREVFGKFIEGVES